MAKLWPLLLVVIANKFYHICAKQTPEDADPFFSLVATYGIAMVVSLIMFFCTSSDRNLLHAAGKLNWSTFLFGLCVVALEFGFLNIYRVGWKITTASLIANIGLAVLLLIVGVLFYHEGISLRQLIGIAVCAVGLFLVSK